MLINLRKHKAIIAKNAERCREKGIILPTFAQMKDPALIPDDIKERLKGVGLWDVNPLNLFRINWHAKCLANVDMILGKLNQHRTEMRHLFFADILKRLNNDCRFSTGRHRLL